MSDKFANNLFLVRIFVQRFLSCRSFLILNLVQKKQKSAFNFCLKLPMPDPPDLFGKMRDPGNEVGGLLGNSKNDIPSHEGLQTDSVGTPLKKMSIDLRNRVRPWLSCW